MQFVTACEPHSLTSVDILPPFNCHRPRASFDSQLPRAGLNAFRESGMMRGAHLDTLEGVQEQAESSSTAESRPAPATQVCVQKNSFCLTRKEASQISNDGHVSNPCLSIEFLRYNSYFTRLNLVLVCFYVLRFVFYDLYVLLHSRDNNKSTCT